MARVTGLEPATSGVTGQHSNQLSYTRAFFFRTNLIWYKRSCKGFTRLCQEGLCIFKKNYQIPSLFLRLEKFFLKESPFNC